MKRSFYALLCAMLMFCAFLFVSCGDETEEPAPNNGGQQTTVCTQHAPVKDGEDKAATCTEKGYQAGTKCSVCNTVLSEGKEILAKGHNHGAWEVVTEATCVEAGQQKKTCPDCGDVITEAIPATGVHTYGDWDVVTEATCAAAGEQKKTCSVCGDEVTEEIPATGEHTYGDWDVVTEATCTTAGEQKKTCSVCGDEVTEPIPATGEHTYVDGVCTGCGAEEVVAPGTFDTFFENAGKFQAAGFMTFEITEDLDEGVVAAFHFTDRMGMNYVYVYELADAAAAEAYAATLKPAMGATATVVDNVVVYGTADAKSYVTGEAEPYNPPVCEHTNTTVQVVAGTAATCGTAGFHFDVTVCTECGFELDSTRVEDPATGEHAYGDWEVVTGANCITAGEQKKICSVCGDEVTEPIPATGEHTFVDGACSVCGEKENGAGSEDCEHDYDWKFGNNTHWKECTACGDKIGEAVHSWDSDEGIVCVVCGYDFFENGHECEFSEEWSYNADYHWHAAICGHEDEEADRDEHSDEDGDKVCDVCDCAIVAGYNPEDKYSTYNWGTTDIYVCLNENSNNKELTSNLRRYLAGDTTEDDVIDDMVKMRNKRAIEMTHVNVKYTYWGAGDTDNANAGWGKTIERISNLVLANAPGSPDVYCNQIYDMVSASLKQCFANIRTTKLSGGDNNFSFMEPEYEEYRAVSGEEWGYMMEYMTELGFSIKKQYLIASDYFIDLVRAFFVVPMNLNLLAEIDIDSSTGDKDGDEDFDVDDFYAMVMEGDWTYDTLIQYGEAIFSGTSGNVNGSMEDRNGFILTPSNGMFSSALLYTTSIKIFDRELKEDGFYHVSYPQVNEDLYDFCDALAELVQSQAVYVEGVTHLAIREQFVADNVLFGGVILLGSLEDPEYQAMKSNGGFGILPVPLYREGDNYLTIIHNMGRIAGIAATTTEFAQCSAYLDYQSTHSTEILDEYYEYKLQYDMAGGTKGNIEILKYIRKNVRSAFDKTYEDAIGYYFKGADQNSSKNSWAGILSENNFEVTTMRSLYITNKEKRVAYLEEIIKAYDKLPE